MKGESTNMYEQIKLLFKCLVLVNENATKMSNLAFFQIYKFVLIEEFCEFPILKWKEEKRSNHFWY